MSYIFVQGNRKGSTLLYDTDQKHLYVKKVARGNNVVFICYQTILSADPTASEDQKMKCTSRVNKQMALLLKTFCLIPTT